MDSAYSSAKHAHGGRSSDVAKATQPSDQRAGAVPDTASAFPPRSALPESGGRAARLRLRREVTSILRALENIVR